MTEPSRAKDELIAHYLERLERHLVLCHQCRQREDRWDVFLWSARCAQEAMLMVLLSHDPPANGVDPEKKDLLEVCKNRALIPRDTWPTFENIRRIGNLGAHVQADLPKGYQDGVSTCAKLFPVVVTWFFERSPIRREMPPAISEALDGLENDLPGRSPEERQIEVLEAARADLSRQKEKILAEIAALGRENAHLRKTCEDQLRQFERLRDPPESEAKAQNLRPAKAHRRRARSLTALKALGFVLGLAATLGLLWFLLRPGAQLPRLTCTPSFSTQPDTDPPGDADSPVSDAGEEPPREGDASAADSGVPQPDCPEGMVEVAGGMVVLKQPHRPYWPAPLGKIEPFYVEPFCIHKRPVSREQFANCVEKVSCRPGPLEQARKVPSPVSSDAMSWVKWDDADGFCKAQGWSLPTVEQYEAALGLLAEGFLVIPESEGQRKVGWYEWTSSPFPAAVFNRGATEKTPDNHIVKFHTLMNKIDQGEGETVWPSQLKGAPSRWDWSWNYRLVQKQSHENQGFRCAVSTTRTPRIWRP
jgi:formylglycine-generating enzyme required for sulfatase activity